MAMNQSQIHFQVINGPGRTNSSSVASKIREETEERLSHFGSVFQARIAGTNEFVAIKRVPLEQKYKNREVEILSTLEHPNICQLKHAFITEGSSRDHSFINLVLEYVPYTLYGVVKFLSKQNRILPLQAVKRYSCQLAAALRYIHSKNICHRDIKLQNLLVNDDPIMPVLQVCDFGSAKELKPGEKSVSYICSRFYRAPELVLGTTEYSVSIDMWSFGCVLAELLQGHPLFPGESASDQFLQIVKLVGTPNEDDLISMKIPVIGHFPPIAPLPLASVFPPNTDPLVLDLLNKVLVYNPQKRFTAEQAFQHPFFDSVRSDYL
ncbi:putative protein kinase [Blattamonas nauphoetae]|uniref:Protein kinase domain-containing protein n=1 Tax=Blattamonas nauphoetae TaxID=2049346 RepID=A0ABQ9YCE6_9EUKA|nr:putative protein kinase [Blattamonas nauphoetae]